MRIILVATEKSLLKAWENHCGRFKGVNLFHGGIFEAGADATVCPLLADCHLDRGLGLHFKSVLGGELETRIQDIVRCRHGGRLALGCAEIVSSGLNRMPYVIASALAESPAILKGTTNPYLCAAGALRLIRDGFFLAKDGAERKISEVVRSVAIPGLGTGGYKVPPEQCAMQVAAAISKIFPALKGQGNPL